MKGLAVRVAIIDTASIEPEQWLIINDLIGFIDTDAAERSKIRLVHLVIKIIHHFMVLLIDFPIMILSLIFIKILSSKVIEFTIRILAIGVAKIPVFLDLLIFLIFEFLDVICPAAFEIFDLFFQLLNVVLLRVNYVISIVYQFIFLYQIP